MAWKRRLITCTHAWGLEQEHLVEKPPLCSLVESPSGRTALKQLAPRGTQAQALEPARWSAARALQPRPVGGVEPAYVMVNVVHHQHCAQIIKIANGPYCTAKIHMYSKKFSPI